MSHKKKTVPKSMLVQIARIFGEQSVELKSLERTNTQWKRILQKMLDELFKYAEENIHTDQLHWFMICSGFCAAHKALEDDEFWPGYTERIIRICYLLMGDYPDHKKYKGGRKGTNHYTLSTFRNAVYIQNPHQKKRTIYAASSSGIPNFTVNIRDALSEFRNECGFKVGSTQFLSWFKQRYPSDYATLF